MAHFLSTIRPYLTAKPTLLSNPILLRRAIENLSDFYQLDLHDISRLTVQECKNLIEKKIETKPYFQPGFNDFFLWTPNTPSPGSLDLDSHLQTETRLRKGDLAFLYSGLARLYPNLLKLKYFSPFFPEIFPDDLTDLVQLSQLPPPATAHNFFFTSRTISVLYCSRWRTLSFKNESLSNLLQRRFSEISDFILKTNDDEFAWRRRAQSFLFDWQLYFLYQGLNPNFVVKADKLRWIKLHPDSFQVLTRLLTAKKYFNTRSEFKNQTTSPSFVSDEVSRLSRQTIKIPKTLAGLQAGWWKSYIPGLLTGSSDQHKFLRVLAEYRYYPGCLYWKKNEWELFFKDFFSNIKFQNNQELYTILLAFGELAHSETQFSFISRFLPYFPEASNIDFGEHYHIIHQPEINWQPVSTPFQTSIRYLNKKIFFLFGWQKKHSRKRIEGEPIHDYIQQRIFVGQEMIFSINEIPLWVELYRNPKISFEDIQVLCPKSYFLKIQSAVQNQDTIPESQWIIPATHVSLPLRPYEIQYLTKIPVRKFLQLF